MILGRYELTAGKNLTNFEFLSEGKKGQILKIIQFQQMNLDNLYDLTFGDKNLETGNLDDKVITDNLRGFLSFSTISRLHVCSATLF